MSDTELERQTLSLEDLPVQLSIFTPDPIVRPEYNIGKFAGIIFASPYARNLDETIEHQWEVKQHDRNLSASLVVAPRQGSKRPTTTTFRVFLALLQVWTHNGKPTDGVIHFSARQLASIIGWRWGGQDTAKRIAEHVKILTGTSITWTFSFLRHAGIRDRLVSDMSLISSSDYAERKLLFGDELFSVVQRVRLNPDLVENMLASYERPLNYEALRAISNDTALNLYTRIDLYLAKKPRWERRSEALFRDELGLVGKRYEKRFARHAKLKKLVAELDGKALVEGRLKLWIEETADRTDYKLVAQKVVPLRAEAKRALKRVNGKEEAAFLAGEIIAELRRHPHGGNPKEGYLLHLCELYPADLLYRALATAKADYHGVVKKTLTHVFHFELKRLVRQTGGLIWHQDVPRREEAAA